MTEHRAMYFIWFRKHFPVYCMVMENQHPLRGGLRMWRAGRNWKDYYLKERFKSSDPMLNLVGIIPVFFPLPTGQRLLIINCKKEEGIISFAYSDYNVNV